MIEIIFVTIPRWHCIDLVLKNLELASKPEDTQILAIISGDDKYAWYVEERLNKIFKKVRIYRTPDNPVEHDAIRLNHDVNQKKIENIYKAYRYALSNIDHSADYYWIIEDDTLFPLDTCNRYLGLMEGLNADIISGISYYWHEEMQRNFWNLEMTRLFGEGDTSTEYSSKITPMQVQKNGVVRLGATGLGNVLVRRKAFEGWECQYNAGQGADIDYFIYAYKNNFVAYGVWDIFLPHITKYENGDINILGRLDKSLIPIINR